MPWIQVDLGSNHLATGLQTEGNYANYWVAQIKVQVGLTEENLIFIKDSQGQPEVYRTYCILTTFSLNKSYILPYQHDQALRPST